MIQLPDKKYSIIYADPPWSLSLIHISEPTRH